jgi:sugar lactone lactonase YvrE
MRLVKRTTAAYSYQSSRNVSMRERHPWWTAAAALTLTSAAACTSDHRESAAGAKAAGTDTAPAATPADRVAVGSFKKSGETRDFKHPESVRYDSDLDVWFVSNINGDPLAKDNNGFISRLTSDGKVDSLKFISGGTRGVTLNGPKGLAIVGDTLWVADIDAVRGFNKRTGKPVATVNLAGKAKFLNDITVGPDGIYITDSGFGPGANGQFSHPGPDRVYHVGPGHKAIVALQSDSLAAPNGITWIASRSRFVIVPFGGKSIEEWAPGEKAAKTIGTGPGMQDGVESLADGRLLVTSWTDSSLFVLDNGRAVSVAKADGSPADIGIDSKRNRLAVPLLMQDKVEFWDIPAGGGAGKP